MAGHHKYSELRAKMSPDRRSRNEWAAEAMLAAMELDELRKARNLTQEELAERLQKRQGNVSRTLRRTDMHVSTLRDVIEAMGGELVITAHFSDVDVRIDQFDPVATGA